MRAAFFVAIVLGAAAVCLLASGVAAEHTRWYELEKKGYDFEQYVAEFGKRYDSAEEHEMRRAVFTSNLQTILAHNRQPHRSWKMGVNHLTDHTDAEFRSMLGYDKRMAHAARTNPHPLAKPYVPVDVKLSASVDWRSALTPVKDQGKCGSCWAFASTETMESHWFLKTGQMFDLSPQQVASCTSNPQDCGGTGGCGGGIAELAFAGVQNASGIASEFAYPYMSWSGNNYACLLNEPYFSFQPAATVSGWVKLPVNDQNALLNAVATQGPIAVSVDASNWRLYESGIFDQCHLDAPDVDHVVQLVGYGTDAGKDYWLIRNSWTPKFGELGFIRLWRPSTAQCGVDTTPGDGSACIPYPSNVTVCGCSGVLSDSSYPLMP